MARGLVRTGRRARSTDPAAAVGGDGDLAFRGLPTDAVREGARSVPKPPIEIARTVERAQPSLAPSPDRGRLARAPLPTIPLRAPHRHWTSHDGAPPDTAVASRRQVSGRRAPPCGRPPEHRGPPRCPT